MKFHLLGILSFFAVLSFFFSFISAEPFGSLITSGESSRSNLTEINGNDTKTFAGNLTEIIVSSFMNTQSWQGYFGNVSGSVMQLADAADNVLYNWSLASAQGEVYASVNNTIGWDNVQCFNFTANGSYSNSMSGESAGATNLGGLNVTQIETFYNLSSSDPDGLDETFRLGNPINHDTFYVSNLNFSAGECPSTALYDISGQTDGQFEEVLLYDKTTASLIFTSILENNLLGFNNGTNDFEMIVLEDGHFGDTETTTYYFYVELG